MTANAENLMRYILAWLIGVPFGLVALWFVLNRL
jgi:hypothetical protein